MFLEQRHSEEEQRAGKEKNLLTILQQRIHSGEQLSDDARGVDVIGEAERSRRPERVVRLAEPHQETNQDMINIIYYKNIPRNSYQINDNIHR